MGRGGGVLFYLDDERCDFTISSNSQFLSNDAQFGRDLFITSPNLTTSIFQMRLQFFPTVIPIPPPNPALMSGIFTHAPLIVIPLRYFMMPLQSPLHVAASGTDVVV
jgi:hypothetical protein